MVSKSIIERHNKYREYAHMVTNQIQRGMFWQKISKGFDAILTPTGYECSEHAKAYMPTIYTWDKLRFSGVSEKLWMEYKSLWGEISNVSSVVDSKFAILNNKLFCVDEKYLLIDYHFLLARHIIKMNPGIILEIGAGSGGLSALFHYCCGSKIVIIDLPEMLILSSAFLLYLFPNARILLPNEFEPGKEHISNYDIILIYPEQIKDMEWGDKVDLAVNIASFMEMDYEEVKYYFQLIDNQLKIGGFFFCSNRSKVTLFQKYPWDDYKNFKDVYFEKCKFPGTARVPPPAKNMVFGSNATKNSLDGKQSRKEPEGNNGCHESFNYYSCEK